MSFTFTNSIVLALSLAAFPAWAFEDATRQPLQLRSRSAIATAVATATPNASAPYARPVIEPEREPLIARHDLRENQSRSSCESGRDLCYDQQSGRIVYKAARNYMPDLPGLQAENISVKRDRIVFKYSF
jgi:hypothetical protein